MDKKQRKQYRKLLINSFKCPKCKKHSLIKCPVNRNIVTDYYYCPFCNKSFKMIFIEKKWEND